VPVAPRKEEYLDSEKYEIKAWDLRDPKSISPLVARVNRARRENLALQRNENVVFHQIDNEELIAYSKATDDLSNIIVVIVNLDFRWKQSGFLTLPLEKFGLDPAKPYVVHDLLTDQRFTWQGPRNYVELRPDQINAHILRIEKDPPTAATGA
jgi:starch synthase (maltosyl-transferring)